MSPTCLASLVNSYLSSYLLTLIHQSSFVKQVTSVYANFCLCSDFQRSKPLSKPNAQSPLVTLSTPFLFSSFAIACRTISAWTLQELGAYAQGLLSS